MRRLLTAALTLLLVACGGRAWASIVFDPDVFQREAVDGPYSLGCPSPPALLAQDTGDPKVDCYTALPLGIDVDGSQIVPGSLGAAATDDTICKADGTDCPPDIDTDTTCLDAGVDCHFAASSSEGGAATSVAANGVDTNAIQDGAVTQAKLGGTINLSAFTFTAGAGIGFSSNTLFVDSNETGFVSDVTTLGCGSGTKGRLALVDGGTVLNYCDDAGTPAQHYLAIGNSSGAATELTCTGCVSPSELASSGFSLTSSSVNGVTPSTSAGSTTYLNGAGSYTTPPDLVGYEEVLDESTARTKRAKLKMIGSIVSCVDNAGAGSTDCTWSDPPVTASLTAGAMEMGNNSGVRTVYSPPFGRDVRTGLAACNGSTDDAAAINSLISAISSGGGGRVLIPGGQECEVASDITVLAGVNLFCMPKAKIQAASGGTFTNGVVTAASQADVSITGCEIDLNGKATSAIKITGGTNSYVGYNYAYGGSTSSTHTLISVQDGGDYSLVERNRVECSATGTPSDVGIDVDGPSTSPAYIEVRGNLVEQCDAKGIEVGDLAMVHHNGVKVDGASAVGIDLLNSYEIATENLVECSGSGSVCVDSDGSAQKLSDNLLRIGGSAAVGFEGTGIAQTSWDGNFTEVSGSTAVGYSIAGTWLKVSDCVSIDGTSGTETGEQHIRIGKFGSGNGITIDSCKIANGNIGIAPTQVAGDYDGGAVINVTVTDSEIWGQEGYGVVMVTGWQVNSNRIPWQEATSIPVSFGDDRTFGATMGHGTLNDNLIHCVGCATPVKFTDEGYRCADGTQSLLGSVCTPGTEGTDCGSGGGGAQCGEDAGGQISRTRQFTIGNNTLIAAATNGVFVDMDGDGYDANSPPVETGTISGNQFHDTNSGQKIFQLSSGFNSKYTNLRFGVNGWNGVAGAYLENYTSANGTWIDAPRQTCLRYDNVADASDNQFFNIAPAPGLTVVSGACICVGTCTTMATITLQACSDPSCSSGTVGSAFNCGTTTTWSTNPAGEIAGGYTMEWDNTRTGTSPTTDDYIVCFQYET